MMVSLKKLIQDNFGGLENFRIFVKEIRTDN